MGVQPALMSDGLEGAVSLSTQSCSAGPVPQKPLSGWAARRRWELQQVRASRLHGGPLELQGQGCRECSPRTLAVPWVPLVALVPRGVGTTLGPWRAARCFSPAWPQTHKHSCLLSALCISTAHCSFQVSVTVQKCCQNDLIFETAAWGRTGWPLPSAGVRPWEFCLRSAGS